MSTTAHISLKEILAGKTSRVAGRLVYRDILSILNSHKTIEMDFKGVNLTPSVADELIGSLAEKLGKSAFKQRIKVRNSSTATKALLKHVIARRLSTI